MAFSCESVTCLSQSILNQVRLCICLFFVAFFVRTKNNFHSVTVSLFSMIGQLYCEVNGVY